MPLVIFSNKFEIDSLSKGSDLHSSLYRMTPQDQTSTSGPSGVEVSDDNFG